MSSTTQANIKCLPDLVPVMRRVAGIDEILAALSRGDSATIDGAWGSSCALIAAMLAEALNAGERGASAGSAGGNGGHSPPYAAKKGGRKPRRAEKIAEAAGETSDVQSRNRGTLLVVLPRISEVDDLAVDLAAFWGQTPLIFPAWESIPREQSATDPVFTARLRVLRELISDRPPRVIVTSFPALLQPVPSRAELERGTRTLHVGEQLDPEELLRWLVARRFERVAAIEFPGEFSMHGGIVDLFSTSDTDPLRIEFFGDEIESIRRFDRATQRKIEDLPQADLTVVGPVSDRATGDGPKVSSASGDALQLPPTERADGATGRPAVGGRRGQETRAERKETRAEQSGRADGAAGRPAVGGAAGSGDPRRTEESASEHIVDALPPGSWIALAELGDMLDEGRHYLGRLDNPRGFFSVDATFARCVRFPTVTVSAIAGDSAETSCHLQIESIERFDAPSHQVVEELTKVVGRDQRVLIACHNAGERERLAELLAETELLKGGRVELCEGHLLRGFRMVGERLIVLSDHELFGRRDIRRVTAKKAKIESRAIDSFLELSQGDLVVHLAQGIARYRGMELLTKGEQAEEHLVLEFRDAVKVYVPVSLIHLVQKYVGGSKSSPTLSKLGSGSWERKKEAVSAAVADMASDMIRLQAERAAKPGLAFPPDSHWQEEFEAAFPYTETDDQLASIAAIKADMQRPRPMDRLICGDVGYGKTELSIRAAFKAIDAGKQVAVLVPTTVLAEQHYRTFSERMAEFPFSIEVLSRFKTKAQQRRTLEGLKSGSVDLVIGTHRLVQPDVEFSDLGLLVIDEEQRFGVDAKEMLKKLRLELDVLTMSATPIPRTLHLSLLGIRAISNLQTPPHDRLAIETRISRFDGELIRQAIVRELNRAGQVYFVHNRVYNIHAIADRIQSIVPEARIGVAHGQMSEHELEDAMVDFVNGKTDVLMATTIIESGLDIPNANTIFIHQADNYGLADLHQLRGRVGRYKHRAYCYLLLEEGKSLSSTAAKRLKAIEEFSELGAGFKIAMRDLEIRGAGNILGTEQSGHIASVGYELYCQLLENAVRRLKHEPIRDMHHVAVDLPLPAYLPGSYVPPGRHKIEVYRKLSRIESFEQLEEFQNELRDRFGPAPEPVQNLFEIKRVQLMARFWQIDDIHREHDFIVFRYRNAQRINDLARLAGRRLRIVDGRSAYLPIPAADMSASAIFELAKSVLQLT